MLHLTNGDMAVGVLREAELPGSYLPGGLLVEARCLQTVSPKLRACASSSLRPAAGANSEWKQKQFLRAMPHPKLRQRRRSGPVVRVRPVRSNAVVSGSRPLNDQPSKPARLSMIGVDKNPDGTFRGLSQIKLNH